MIEHPPLGTVQLVVAALQQQGIVCAVGGSGLLAALGLVERVRDWDVTTDAGVVDVESALTATGVSVREADGGLPWATSAHFVVDAGDHEVDVLVSFAIHVDGRIVHFPTGVTRQWLGLPIGDPTVWLSAYEAMGRLDSADRLRTFLSQRQDHNGGPVPR